MSLDGYLDDASPARLVLSGPEDLDRVDELRASCHAILIGAGTIRADNPRLRVRSEARREARIARGLPPDPVRVTVTGSGDLDPSARCFTDGPRLADGANFTASAGLADGASLTDGPGLAGGANFTGGAGLAGGASLADEAGGSSRAIVYVATGALAKAQRRLAEVAETVDAGDPADLRFLLADLHRRGVGRLMVEGGASILTQFLTTGLADELQLAVAPFFVGDSRAPRLAGDGHYPWNSARRARLVQVSQVGEDAVLTYALSGRYSPS